MASPHVQLDQRIPAALAALRRRIRWYVWTQGIASLLVVVGSAFWLSLTVDWFFEPPVLARKILLLTALFAIAVAAYRSIGRRAFVPLSDRSMAILLERRFPEFDDSLLTAVELTARPPDPNDCNRTLLEATCQAATEPFDQVRIRDVFDSRPLRMAIISALLFLVATGIFRGRAPDAFSVWFRRTLLMSNELWPRRTVLVVEGFPGGVARVAKGGDFTLIAKADTTARHVPRSVRIDYRAEGSPRLDATMIREGQAEAGRDRYQVYSYTFRGILAPIQLTLRGGDAAIPDLRIEVVDAPTLVQLDALCSYPGYMGKTPRTLPVAGVVPIPRGTEVILQAEANKRLTKVDIVDGENTQFVADVLAKNLHEISEVLHGTTRTTHEKRTPEEVREKSQEAVGLLEKVGVEVRRRFSKSLSEDIVSEILQEITAARADLQRLVDGSTSGEELPTVDERLNALQTTLGTLVSFKNFQYRLQPIDDTKELELVLHDVDGIKSHQPIRIMLSAVEDQPPRPVVRLDGIGSAITPQARLPVRGEVNDDYGVERVWLEYAVEGREPRRRTLMSLPGITTQVQVSEAFEVADLLLEPGHKILITVKARDRCDLNPEPNVGVGDRWILDVVTPERLRAMLEAREIVLRQRFETIVEDVQQIRDTLAELSFEEESTSSSRQPAEPARALEPGEEAVRESSQRKNAIRLLRIQRARQNGQKDSHETVGVYGGFGDIRQELINNRIYTEELRIRIEQDIVAPLTDLVQLQFVQLDEELARLEVTPDDPLRSPDYRDAAVAQTDRILKTMREVLARMVELEDFNEAVQLLRSIIEEQEQLREAVRERRKAKLRLLLED